MSIALSSNPANRRAPPATGQASLGGVRLAVGLLLVIELIALSLRFDTATIEHVGGPWSALLGQASLFGRFAISLTAALIVFNRCGLASSWREIVGDVDDSRRSIFKPLLVHGVGLAAFYLLTGEVLEQGRLEHGDALAWIAGWTSAAVVAASGWALALYPWSVWRLALARLRGLLAFGVLLGAGAVLGGKLIAFFWPLLGGPTVKLVGSLLSLIYNDVAVDPDELLVRVGDFSALVEAECSGFEGVGLVGVFLGGLLWSLRDQLRFPQALIMLPFGMGLIWVTNVLRLVALVAIGASWSPEVALGGFHSQAGWLAFNAVALGVVYLLWNSAVFRADSAAAETGERYEYAAGPYLAPLLMLVATMMITTAMSAAGFDWLYPIRVVATLGALAFYWSTYRARGYLRWTWSWTPLAIGGAVFALWMLLEPWSGVAADASAMQAQALASVTPSAAALWLVARAVGSVLVVPLVEELAFRGYLTRQFAAEDFEQVPLGTFTWFSFIASSLMFGLLHGRWLAGSLAGALFALALYRRGRMMDAVVAHATANALVTAYVLVTQDWAAWS